MIARRPPAEVFELLVVADQKPALVDIAHVPASARVNFLFWTEVASHVPFSQVSPVFGRVEGHKKSWGTDTMDRRPALQDI